MTAEPAAPAVFRVARLDHFEIGGWLVTALAGLALVSRAVREELESGKHNPPPRSKDKKSIQLKRWRELVRVC